jgi:hypothetical protein
MLPREYTLSQYDRSPPLTACKMLVIVVDSSFVEQVEEPGIYLSKYCTSLGRFGQLSFQTSLISNR